MAGRVRVAMIAPPWLALPIKGYGGIELVVESLVRGLLKQGIEVELFANGAHKMRGVTTHALFKEELFCHIHEPYYEVVANIQAHLLFSLNKIRQDGRFDIIHDHTTHLGPAFWANVSQLEKVPPVLHTFHGPSFARTDADGFGAHYNTADLEQLDAMGKMYMTCISRAMAEATPKNIRRHLLPPVHNAIDVDAFPFLQNKKNYYITLARFSPYKGQDIAVRCAVKLNKRLRMAGTVAGIQTSRKLLLELSNPLSRNRNNNDFRYYSDNILPYILRYPKITYSGNLSGRKKMKFMSEAKALLFPIQWDEPFGMAVIEALACGTPVIAMNRGAMPEIIEHGVNGFLAENEAEFMEYMQRADEIDPVKCRESVEKKFSSQQMVEHYVKRYEAVIKRGSRSR